MHLVGAVNYKVPGSGMAVTCEVTQNGLTLVGTAQGPDATTYTLKVDLVNEVVAVLVRVSGPNGVSTFGATGLDGPAELAFVNAQEKFAAVLGDLQGMDGTSGTVTVGGGLQCP
ncbi:hypothetical protein GCM10022221_65440 [Actinocorallia aurea]